jgi:hypothetical protein
VARHQDGSKLQQDKQDAHYDAIRAATGLAIIILPSRDHCRSKPSSSLSPWRVSREKGFWLQ